MPVDAPSELPTRHMRPLALRSSCDLRRRPQIGAGRAQRYSTCFTGPRLAEADRCNRDHAWLARSRARQIAQMRREAPRTRLRLLRATGRCADRRLATPALARRALTRYPSEASPRHSLIAHLKGPIRGDEVAAAHAPPPARLPYLVKTGRGLSCLWRTGLDKAAPMHGIQGIPGDGTH